MGKFNGLDHLRALAIFQVFFFHYFIISKGKPGWLPDVAAFGWTGVDLFFVLSGFLITSALLTDIHHHQKISLGHFFLKRVFRIIPAYLVTLALYFMVPFFREKEALPAFWRFITFTQNFGLNIKDTGTFSHAWSLCVEEHFYLVLPLILLLLLSTRTLRYGYVLLILLFIAGWMLRILSYEQLYLPHANDADGWKYWYQYIYYPTYNRLDGLLMGVVIAIIFVYRPVCWNKLTRYGNWLLLAGVLLLALAWRVCEDQQTYTASIAGFPLVALGYGLLVTGSLSPVTFLYKKRSRITAFIAATSYAIYLTHKGFISITQKVLADVGLNDNLVLLISIITSLAGAYLLYLLVEQPFMRWRRKLLSKRSS